MIYKTAILIALSMLFVLGATTPTQEKQEVIRFIMPSNKANCFMPLPCPAYAIGYNTTGSGFPFSDTIEIMVDKNCVKQKINPLLRKHKEKNERQISLSFSKIADIRPFH